MCAEGVSLSRASVLVIASTGPVLAIKASQTIRSVHMAVLKGSDCLLQSLLLFVVSFLQEVFEVILAVSYVC